MNINLSIFLIILGCAIVTVIPRILPFMLIKNITLPAIVTKWLSFIPVCLFAALVMSSIIDNDQASFAIKWQFVYALIPTLIVALWTKNLSVTVLAGVVCMAFIRFFM